MDNKIIYISTVEDEGPYQGVQKKIQMQCTAFKDLGFEVAKISSGRRSLWGQLVKLCPLGYGINYRAVKKETLLLPKDSYKYCYIRYSPASRGLVDVLKTLKANQAGIKNIIEIPTYPYEAELKSIKAIPSKIGDRIYRTKIKRYADLIVTPSYLEQKEIFEIPAMEITNGISTSHIKQRTPSIENKKIVNIIGVAAITKKQGYDRIIRGIYQYYQHKNPVEPDVFFYIIGTGPFRKELELLSDELLLSKYIIFVGEKEKEELEYYYSIASVGVGSLGLYNTGELKKVNSLKTREYCAKGLPFIITVCDYIFVDSNVDFCMIVENNNTPILIHDVISFLNFLKAKYSEDSLAETMINFANERLDWSAILASVIRRVNNI